MSLLADGRRPRRYEGVRLPAPTPEEERGYPVVVYDAAGAPVAWLTPEVWRANEARCPHGYRHCFSCRHRLPSAPSRVRTEPIAVAG